MKKKSLVMLIVTVLIIITAAMTVFAGQWKQDGKGWWYENDDRSYPVNCWKWIDGNNDGIAECYCFDSQGYCLVNTLTPDGCKVDGNGAWIENGAVQTRSVASEAKTSAQTDILMQYLGAWGTDYDEIVQGPSKEINISYNGNIFINFEKKLAAPVDCNFYNCRLDNTGAIVGDCEVTASRNGYDSGLVPFKITLNGNRIIVDADVISGSYDRIS